MPAKESNFVNVGLPIGLMADVEAFIEQSPHWGIANRSDFTKRAVLHYLELLRDKDQRRLTMQALGEGRIGVVEAARRMGVKPPGEN